MTKYALLFPGQGSQYVGMGRSIFETKKGGQLFAEAEQVLSLPLKRLMFEGSAEELTRTAIAQPAILLHSMAAFYCAKEQLELNITVALGHSLGEYSALVAANVLDFKDAIKAVHVRGLYMQEAVPNGQGAMAAVLGIKSELIVSALLEFADEHSDDYVSCANFNGPAQTVIAGRVSGIKKASEKLKSLGARRIIELPVSAPFHCALMKPVADKMAKVLSNIHFADAQFPIISNVSAKSETKGEVLRELLLKQIASPVRFTECVDFIKNNNLMGDGFLELGPKNTLSGIVKKIHSESLTVNVDEVNDLEKLKSEE